MSVSFKLVGLKELQDQLVQLGAVGGKRVLTKAGREAMKIVQAEAKARVSVDEGVMRESIKVAVTGAFKTGTVLAAGIKMGAIRVRGEIEIADGVTESIVIKKKAAAWRYHFLEFGTSHSDAKPFLRPAFAAAQARMVDRFRDVLRQNIDKALQKQLEADPQ